MIMNINELLPEDMFPMEMTVAATGETIIVLDGTPEAEDVMWNRVKMVRDAYLMQSDWTQNNDSPLDSIKKEAWREYRTALRDIPQNFTHPRDVVFPEPPGGR